MDVTPTAIADVLLIKPSVHRDARGCFYEAWNGPRFSAAIGREVAFVQDNYARSHRNVVRGLHYQVRCQQGKLVWVAAGRVFDVAVDLRRDSATFGRWVGMELDADERRQLWIPPGFAHGYLALTEPADIAYKATELYAPEHDRAIAWDDPEIGIEWPLVEFPPIMSAKDEAAPRLADAELPGTAP